MNELIEKLKKNKVAFVLLSPEEQECLKKVGKENCLVYCLSNIWQQSNYGFNNTATYVIKPDYQPNKVPPEFVDLEITLVANLLGTYDKGIFCPLYKLPSLPNFEGFIEKGVGGTLAIEKIARYIDQGKQVYARFRV